MEQRTSEHDIRLLLCEGEVLQKRLLSSSNYTFLVELGLGESDRCSAVYKPRDGETPLWDFPSGTLYRRERLAYSVSESLGWGLVPPTIIREGPDGPGMMQQFVRHEQRRHYFNMMPDYRDQLFRIAVFDCVINNCDRKGGHCLLDEEGRVWAIDHGLSFTAGSKLRTVMWDLAEEPLGVEIKDEVAALCRDTSLLKEMLEHLSPGEVEAFHRRVEAVLRSERVPIADFSDPYRPVPWPQI